MSVAAENSPLAPRTTRLVAADGSQLRDVDTLLALPVDTAAWWTRLARDLDALEVELWEHRAAMDGPDGLSRDVVTAEPRLAFRARSLERDLAALLADVAQLRRFVGAAMGRPGGVATVVPTTSEVVARVRTHHRRVRQMLHEAYGTDLGTSE